MADHCLLCERPKEPSSEFCNLHNAAIANLANGYSSWKKAYSNNLNKDEYYAKVEALPETGQAVKSIIQHIRGKGAVG
jgi:hypothetical protein